MIEFSVKNEIISEYLILDIQCVLVIVIFSSTLPANILKYIAHIRNQKLTLPEFSISHII